MNKHIIILSGILIFMLILTVSFITILKFNEKKTLTTSTIQSTNLNTINSKSNTDYDKCKAPEGYNEKEWREHMSHHPDMYKECL